MNFDDWYEKCVLCRHCYRRKDDAETVYCRLRKGECHFSPVVELKRDHERYKVLGVKK